ncbi:MAG TPA: glycosyltransferase family 9 protein [Vicinamibacterales bacterium]|nr:glycosyltransferase family 9 protein [Vicinamibacterales bacterium]
MKILLIRLRMIGDVVFTTPIPRALKRTFPNARLTYLVEPAAAPVITGNPHLDEVIVVPRTRGVTRLLGDLALARTLRRKRFDVVLDLHGGPRSSWLAWATGAAQRIGYDVQGRGWQYTRRVHRPRQLQPRHSVVNQWDLLQAIDGWPGTAADPSRDAVEMPVDPSADKRIAERLRAAGVDERNAIVVVHVSAGNPFRRWPEPAFARLVAALASADDGRRIILSSGPSDKLAADRIAANARALLGPALADRVLDFGDVNLAELRALVGRSALFVGGDSGPLHIAATTATPIVGIYGPTLAARSAPWRDPQAVTESVQIEGLACRPCEQRTCAPGDFRCLTTIDPESVITAAERALRAAARWTSTKKAHVS